ncbi:MAG: MFS transporter [Desulfobacteraceae bacterium]|jgi:FSR family fosmidomycin resistance protein-like MFS transporter
MISQTRSSIPERSKADVKVIFALALVHFTGDFYASFVHPLLPLFVQKLSLSLTQVGLIAGVSRFFAFIVQPPAGYIADHYRTRLFVLGGPLLAVVFIPFVGVAPSFLLLLLFICFGSIGSAMFHPTSAGMVPSYAGSHPGFSMSIFNMGGTFAFGVGPLFITYFVHTYGLEASPFTMIIGFPLVALLIMIVPFPGGEGLGKLGFIGSIRETLGTVWKSIVLIWVVMVLRSFVTQSFLTFLPVFYANEGHSLISIGAIVSIFTVAGALSGLLAGHLSDRVGYKPVFFTAHGLATPSLLLLLILSGKWVYGGALLAGFFVLATLPLGVSMAQELAPRGRSMVSSLMMGLAFGTGGMMTPLTGMAADIYSIRPVLCLLAVVPLLTTGLIARLQEKRLK